MLYHGTTSYRTASCRITSYRIASRGKTSCLPRCTFVRVLNLHEIEQDSWVEVCVLNTRAVSSLNLCKWWRPLEIPPQKNSRPCGAIKKGLFKPDWSCHKLLAIVMGTSTAENP